MLCNGLVYEENIESPKPRKQLIYWGEKNTSDQTRELYTHLFVILHMLIDVMGNNALQKCWHTCTITKSSVVT